MNAITDQTETETETETRKAWIPTSMLSDFKGRVADLNKRASRLKCDPITYNITDEKDTIKIPAEQYGGYVKPGYNYEVTKVNISGTTPIIPGFQVIAKIDHDAELGTNIIMELGKTKLPKKFFKMNDLVVKSIIDIYPPIKPVKTKSR